MSEYGMTGLVTDLSRTLCYCVLCYSVISHVYATISSTDMQANFTTPRNYESHGFHHSTEKEINETTTISSSLNQTIEPVLNPDEHKIVEHLREQGLYYNFQSILNDVNNHQLKTGIIDLMSVYNRSEWIAKMKKRYQARDQIKKKKRMIFINIESVYSSKREMITKTLARRLRGKQMTSPPKFMADIRIIVGHGVARKLYYSITKYSTAHHVEQLINTQAIVLERYWLHHAAFVIGKAFNESELPPRGHAIYRWPKDLLKPDVVFFVNATKDFGKATGFTQPYTPFTDRLIKIFRRVEGVNVVEMNPSKNVHTIVKYMIDYITEHFKDHPDIIVPNCDPTSNKKIGTAS